MVDYDVIVIGGGAAGLAAARTGNRRGARTLLVHDGPLGGECTFTGCVPSKTLIAAAKRGVPYEEAHRRMEQIVTRIARTEDAATLSGEGIDVRQGRARFRTSTEIEVDDSCISGKSFVVATGSKAARPPVSGLLHVSHLTNETLFDLTVLPDSLAVIGGGAIGCELAQAFARFGTKVVVIEAADRLLSNEESEASALVEHALVRDGVDVRTRAKVERVEARSSGVRLTLGNGADVEAQQLLVATGRSAVTEGLDLGGVGVSLDEKGNIRTDAYLHTTVSGIYAAGDVTGRLPFTHAADAMGRIAAGNALRPSGPSGSWRRSTYSPRATPWVTFTDPEVARVGVTEAEAVDRGGRVAYLPLDEVDRALTADRTDGFIKIIAGPRPVLRGIGGGEILGATIVAERAGEMIAEIALAMHTRMFAGRLAQATHAYPTWSSGVQLAAAQLVMKIHGRSARPADAGSDRPGSRPLSGISQAERG